MNAAADEQRDRYRSQFAAQQEVPRQRMAPAAPVSVDELPPAPRPNNRPQQLYEGLPPEYDDPPAPHDDEPPYDDDDAETRVINGRHRRGLGG